ncbi:hypothetical protein [Halococcus saccharolyticus]|uniref:Uncharacterized protein n=1 Tax=Halococcus saccharolyticus DSM 5350 TaxID=1227455 RepID=M0MPP7_9EURY|nr:hypothetical protein [Halococcus saccharolyticus]EMA47611.1 hypothetical protein C449_01072 [Halococcus saccharolyticus DSM 5350]
MFPEPNLRGYLIVTTHFALLGLIILGSIYDGIPLDWQVLVLLLGILFGLLFKERITSISAGPVTIDVTSDDDSGDGGGEDE